MLTALTRKPGPELALCELEFLSRSPIDIAKALAQSIKAVDPLHIDISAFVALADSLKYPVPAFVFGYVTHAIGYAFMWSALTSLLFLGAALALKLERK